MCEDKRSCYQLRDELHEKNFIVLVVKSGGRMIKPCGFIIRKMQHDVMMMMMMSDVFTIGTSMRLCHKLHQHPASSDCGYVYHGRAHVRL